MSDLGLIEAVKNGDSAAAEMLIKGGADVNQQDEQGWTPLNFAAGKGDLAAVKLLVEKGADVFKTGRDRRTPYMIALAAGRVSVVKYLREVEDNFPGEKPARAPQKYCKAYYLKNLRSYPAWSESRINWKEQKEGDNGDHGEAGEAFPDDKVVFIHQDLTVTESVWHDENVIFTNVDAGWEEFCANSLNFKVPDDLDLIVPNEANG
jgi:uncharacterized protein